ncbi:hypothetical protein ACQR3W_21810 [Rhodococcus ruber]|uniref:Uncharacterized protein n=1 Tax=Rhodococcus ruber TaxID=1830 RepID=A0A098BMQ3_9NOCA|nr:hypothetical protein [Rhodococcus ruber]MCZ4533347.1 hypothetical protein [Rhodococcus ruber]MCZ4533402.1 hypothetical protein [Rhodococcus ruber]CDZ88996.1 hypothetical protein RHRU231_450163 [Rhodococcus ruber]
MTTTTVPDILTGTQLFMEAAQQLPGLGWGDPATRNLRRELLAEEINEYLDADDNDDLVEVVDGLLDITVVAHGSRLAYGRDDTTFLIGIAQRRQWHDRDARRRFRLAIEQSADAYFDAEDRGLLDDALIHLANLVQYAANALDGLVGEDAARACAGEVTRSNLSKIVDGKVLRSDTGKILKPAGFTRPDIAGVLTAAGLV